jgi:transcription antitermination factor NusG
VQCQRARARAQVRPTLDELQAFHAGMRNAAQRRQRTSDELGDDADADDEDKTKDDIVDGLDAATLAAVTSSAAGARGGGASGDSKFVKGDTVRVVNGELSGLLGVVQGVRDGMVQISSDVIKDNLDIPMSDVRKHFKTGDHVKVRARTRAVCASRSRAHVQVFGGRFDGETGLVIRVDPDGNVLTVFSDLTMKEFQVLAQDVAIATDVATGKVCCVRARARACVLTCSVALRRCRWVGTISTISSRSIRRQLASLCASMATTFACSTRPIRCAMRVGYRV